jgi:hypothetical protein
MDSSVLRSRPCGRGRASAAAAPLASALLTAALLAAGSGAASASAGAAAGVAAGHGVPEVGSPKVTHEPDSYELLGISCPSVQHCVAVGYGDGSAFAGGVAVPITNGVPGKPVKSGDRTSIFYGVACVSSSECVIAGQATPKDASEAQGEVWLLRGSKLTVIKQAVSSANTMSTFRGAACWSARSAHACEVVGYATSFGKPTGMFGRVSLTGAASVKVMDNTTLGYAAAVGCPSAAVCYVGGATVAEAGAVADLGVKRDTLTGPFLQRSVSGLEAIACPSVSSCGAAEVLNTLPQSGWVEHLRGHGTGTPVAVTGAELMFGIAAVNSSYYLAVGSAADAGGWLTDLMTATGKSLTPAGAGHDGYLQAVSCPVQTECIAVGFSSDSAKVQPGGLDGVDGAIAVFRLRTAPSAPGLSVKSRSGSAVTLRIAPPGSDGGAAVTGYQVAVSRCKPHHKACVLEPVKTVRVAAAKRTVKVTGLSSASTYYFQARATNAIGTGPYSALVHSKG